LTRSFEQQISRWRKQPDVFPIGDDWERKGNSVAGPPELVMSHTGSGCIAGWNARFSGVEQRVVSPGLPASSEALLFCGDSMSCRALFEIQVAGLGESRAARPARRRAHRAVRPLPEANRHQGR